MFVNSEARSTFDISTVPEVVTAAGTAQAVPPGHQLWMFVEYLPDGPHHPAAVTLDGERWKVDRLHVGGVAQAGQRFVLHLAVLAPAAQRRLDEYFTEERRTGASPGLARGRLDSWGADFLSSVRVTRAR